MKTRTISNDKSANSIDSVYINLLYCKIIDIDVDSYSNFRVWIFCSFLLLLQLIGIHYVLLHTEISIYICAVYIFIYKHIHKYMNIYIMRIHTIWSIRINRTIYTHIYIQYIYYILNDETFFLLRTCNGTLQLVHAMESKRNTLFNCCRTELWQREHELPFERFLNNKKANNETLQNKWNIW